MRARRAGFLSTAAIACLLVLPASGSGHHVRVSASVAAHVERSGSDSWRAQVTFSVYCQGAGPGGASFYGNLNMIDVDTGETVYLGGISGASGTTSQLFHSTDRWRRFAPVLEVSCSDDATRHGSETIEVAGGTVLIPPRLGTGGGGGGSGGGGGGGGAGSGSSDPTEPLRPGGCLALVVGSEAADTLSGAAIAEVVLALGGDDDVRGAGGHDCLVGGPGRDNVRGEAGSDRLAGGPGGDRLFGGPGVNAYDAGPGRDFIDAGNAKGELVHCGPGRDRVRADRGDVLRGCEVVVSPRPS